MGPVVPARPAGRRRDVAPLAERGRAGPERGGGRSGRRGGSRRVQAGASVASLATALARRPRGAGTFRVAPPTRGAHGGADRCGRRRRRTAGHRRPAHWRRGARTGAHRHGEPGHGDAGAHGRAGPAVGRWCIGHGTEASGGRTQRTQGAGFGPDRAGPARAGLAADRASLPQPPTMDAPSPYRRGARVVAVQPIRLFGDPVLTMAADPVTTFDKELRVLVKDLTDTMLDAPGVGLAATQIGVSLRVFTYDVDETIGHLINPVI